MRVYLAEVRDIENDPSQSGRVKVRIYNTQNDEQAIPDEDLPWAVPLQPVTSAAYNGIGVAPHGLMVGSRVMIGYLPDDPTEQYPIIFGSFSRAFAPTVKGVQNSPDPSTGGSLNKKAPDHPVTLGKGVPIKTSTKAEELLEGSDVELDEEDRAFLEGLENDSPADKATLARVGRGEVPVGSQVTYRGETYTVTSPDGNGFVLE